VRKKSYGDAGRNPPFVSFFLVAPPTASCFPLHPLTEKRESKTLILVENLLKDLKHLFQKAYS